MKLPKITKLPSGNWRMQLQINGKRYSIVDKDPKVVRQKAKEIIGGEEKESRSEYSVGKAIDLYIKHREPKLSPATIRSYETYRKNYFQSIMGINLNYLTQEHVDDAILMDLRRGITPKTIKNMHGLLTATLKKYRPRFHLDTDLPEIDSEEVQIPSEEDLIKIWSETFSGKYNSDIELTLILAAWLGLRMSEILGLKYEDIDNDHLEICRALVRGKYGEVVKGPKTKAGKRRIRIPEEILKIIDAMPRDSEFIISSPRSTINTHFNKICDNAGVPRFRIHDLRHFAASEALSLNIPNKYQMKRMGHSTEYMLQRVYQHVMKDKEDYFFDPYDLHMSEILNCALENSHEKIKGL